MPKEYLPRDFGGELQSIEELAGTWTDILELNVKIFLALQLKCYEKHKKRFEELQTMKCDESLKPVMVDDDLFGTYGNFKKLNID